MLMAAQGVAQELRPIVWKFLLAVYPFTSTYEERKDIDSSNRFNQFL